MKKLLATIILIIIISSMAYIYLQKEPVLTIFIVRHAESYQNIEKHENMPENLDSLTTKGKEQALNLSTIFKNIPLDLWVSSPYGRTKETRDIVFSANNLKGQVQEDSSFSSMKKGLDEKGEMITWEWREQNWAEKNDSRPNGGESLEDSQKRVVKKIEEWLQTKKFKNVIIFTHSDICAALIGYVNKTEFHECYQKHAPGLAEYTQIKIYDDSIWEIMK